MKKAKILPISLCALALCCALALGPAWGVSPVSAQAEEPREGFENVTEKEGIDGETVPDFGLIAGESEQQVLVKLAEERKRTAIGIVYIVLLAVGIAATGATVYFAIFFKRNKNDSDKRKTLRLSAGILASVFVFAALSGTGIFGMAGFMEDRYETTYYTPGVERSKSAKPDSVKGYTEDMTNRRVLSTFEFGVESKYDRVYSCSPHFWNTSEPKYNYEREEMKLSESYKYEYGGTTDEADNYNFWYTLAAEDREETGEKYYTDAEYRLSMPAKSNYINTNPYDKLRMTFAAENSDKAAVNLTVIADTRRGEALDLDDVDPVHYNLGTYEGKSGDKVELTFNLGVIAPEDRPYLSRLIFRTDNANVKAGGYQRNELYYLEVFSTGKVKASSTLKGFASANTDIVLDMASEYLGTMGYNMYGAYSASGFYDNSAKLWRVWYGCGIPENIASDNIFYMETPDPRMGWSTPKRLILDDPTGKLTVANKAPGYGGDPAVIKVDRTYYMYFSGLENTPSPPNKIYLATSKNGVDFTVYGPVVNVEKMGLGYGAGSPSVVYKDGTYYLYYYTQSPSLDFPNEPTGFVLKKSSDPYHFGEAVALPGTSGAADVKWMPSLGLWVCCDYTEGKSQGGYAYDTIRIGVSADGISWDFTNNPFSRPCQDYSAQTNHNPGFIGNEHGYGFETMFLTYGINDIPLRDLDAGLQMDTRQLGWSRVSFSKGSV